MQTTKTLKQAWQDNRPGCMSVILGTVAMLAGRYYWAASVFVNYLTS